MSIVTPVSSCVDAIIEIVLDTLLLLFLFILRYYFICFRRERPVQVIPHRVTIDATMREAPRRRAMQQGYGTTKVSEPPHPYAVSP